MRRRGWNAASAYQRNVVQFVGMSHEQQPRYTVDGYAPENVTAATPPCCARHTSACRRIACCGGCPDRRATPLPYERKPPFSWTRDVDVPQHMRKHVYRHPDEMCPAEKIGPPWTTAAEERLADPVIVDAETDRLLERLRFAIGLAPRVGTDAYMSPSDAFVLLAAYFGEKS